MAVAVWAGIEVACDAATDPITDSQHCIAILEPSAADCCAHDPPADQLSNGQGMGKEGVGGSRGWRSGVIDASSSSA